MADPEIKLVFNAETGKASKNIQDLYNRILELEKNRGSDFTDKEIHKINDLIETYAKYEHKVVKFNEYVRQINTTEFSNEAVRDKTLENTERKLQIILGYGTQIATAMRDIGINPRVLESFVNLASTLSVANKELDVAFANRERLLKQPTAPKGALVTSYPWENGSSPDTPETPEQQFKNRYSAVAADIEAYQRTLDVTISSTERLKAAFREKYAALKETDEGYIRQKQLLESLMVTTDRQLLSLEKLRGGVQGQIADFEQLYKTTSDNKHWLTGLKGLEERATGVAEMYQKVDIAAQKSINIQNKYNNTQLKANEKATKAEERYQAVLEVQGKTRAELIQLFERYKKAVSEANTAEEMAAAQAGLSATRKQLALVTREAALTGEEMIGTQTSVQGLLTTIGRLGVQGRLTFAALTRGVKLFAKSTVVLAAVQLVWEGISWAIDKAKEALFGTAEAEEEAAEKAKALADAAKKASENLLDAQHALAAWRLDEVRKADAEAFKRTIEEQNAAYKAQVEIIEKIKEERIYAELQESTGKEREIALQKLELQRQRTAGLISEKKYQEELLALEYKSAQIKRNAEVFKKREEADAAEKKLDAAQVAFNAFLRKSPVSMNGFEMSSEKVKKAIENYNLLRAEVDKNNNEFGALLSKKTKLEKRISTAEASGLTFDRKYQENKAELFNISAQLKRFKTAEKQAEEAYEKIPKFVRKLGLTGESVSEYSKQRSSLKKQQDEQEKELERLKKEVERLEKEEAKARQAAERAAAEAKKASEFEAKVNTSKIKNLKAKEKQDKRNQQNDKKVDSIKNEVSELTLEELLQRRNHLKSAIKSIRNQNEKDRLQKQLDVYNDSVRKRRDQLKDSGKKFAASALNIAGESRIKQGEAAGKYVSDNLVSTDKKEIKVINKLAGVATNAISNGKATSKLLSSVEKLAEQAHKTKGNEDNIALERVINLLLQLISATEKNKERAKKFNARLNALSRRAINQDS